MIGQKIEFYYRESVSPTATYTEKFAAKRQNETGIVVDAFTLTNSNGSTGEITSKRMYKVSTLKLGVCIDIEHNQVTSILQK